MAPSSGAGKRVAPGRTRWPLWGNPPGPQGPSEAARPVGRERAGAWQDDGSGPRGTSKGHKGPAQGDEQGHGEDSGVSAVGTDMHTAAQTSTPTRSVTHTRVWRPMPFHTQAHVHTHTLMCVAANVLSHTGTRTHPHAHVCGDQCPFTHRHTCTPTRSVTCTCMW